MMHVKHSYKINAEKSTRNSMTFDCGCGASTTINRHTYNFLVNGGSPKRIYVNTTYPNPVQVGALEQARVRKMFLSDTRLDVHDKQRSSQSPLFDDFPKTRALMERYEEVMDRNTHKWTRFDVDSASDIPEGLEEITRSLSNYSQRYGVELEGCYVDEDGRLILNWKKMS